MDENIYAQVYWTDEDLMELANDYGKDWSKSDAENWLNDHQWELKNTMVESAWDYIYDRL